jgi:negative regulator of flagellin synthesis FlgM
LKEQEKRMAVEITGVNTTPLSESKTGNTKKADLNELVTPRAQNEVNSVPATPADKLTLTKQAEDLLKIEDVVYAQTGIDSDRVDSLKVEIDAGRYDINVQRVAEKLLAFEAQFVA